MIKSLNELKNPNENSNLWVKYLYFTNETNYSLERLKSVSDISVKLVYLAVLKNLEILNESIEKGKIKERNLFYVEETLKWSDVAKVGSRSKRREWQKKEYDLFVHNIGSSQIYVEDVKDYNEVVRVLIKTHGLIGQYIRGEVNFDKNISLYTLITKGLIAKDDLKEVLIVLNECIIKGVSEKLYFDIKDEVIDCIDDIVNGNFEKHKICLKEKFKRLNSKISEDAINELSEILKDKKIESILEKVFSNLELWHYEGALNDFSIEEQIKMLLIISKYIDGTSRHLTFEKIMKTMYLDYNDKKESNIYRKRIIEAYLSVIAFADIIDDNIKENPHIKLEVKKNHNTLVLDFEFSLQATKLIEFCEVAYTSNSMYQKAVYLLYDIFGFRRDQYDRFYNEIDYLNTMNSSLEQKARILDFMVGNNILDIGPGGGALMDLILERDSTLNVYGIDIATNVIDSLNKKKVEEERMWNLIKGDALYLDEYFKEESIDTIIYSSIIHELFSYIEYEGKKFNHDVILKTLKSAYKILSKGGRIIIRDGIMTEPKEDYRIIEFNNINDIEILDRYCADFRGREITYEKINKNKVKMLVNDAMEFLYTYTWGENSFALEVKEQFGYFTPTEYRTLIEENLDGAKIVFLEAFLQTGYEENLLNKISIYDEDNKIVKLPNSTCIMVIEKR
jgi:Methylase involved in ubiquinone/menaquinone biosynthesis